MITWTEPKVARKKSKRNTFYPNNRRHNKRVCKSNLRNFVLWILQCKSNCSHLNGFHRFRCFCRDCQSSDPPLGKRRKDSKKQVRVVYWYTCTIKISLVIAKTNWRQFFFMPLSCYLTSISSNCQKLQRKHFDRVITQFIINKRTDTHTKKNILTSTS